MGLAQKSTKADDTTLQDRLILTLRHKVRTAQKFYFKRKNQCVNFKLNLQENAQNMGWGGVD